MMRRTRVGEGKLVIRERELSYAWNAFESVSGSATGTMKPLLLMGTSGGKETGMCGCKVVEGV